jgi:hypothetical protein
MSRAHPPLAKQTDLTSPAIPPAVWEGCGRLLTGCVGPAEVAAAHPEAEEAARCLGGGTWADGTGRLFVASGVAFAGPNPALRFAAALRRRMDPADRLVFGLWQSAGGPWRATRRCLQRRAAEADLQLIGWSSDPDEVFALALLAPA